MSTHWHRLRENFVAVRWIRVTGSPARQAYFTGTIWWVTPESAATWVADGSGEYAGEDPPVRPRDPAVTRAYFSEHVKMVKGR